MEPVIAFKQVNRDSVRKQVSLNANPGSLIATQ